LPYADNVQDQKMTEATFDNRYVPKAQIINDALGRKCPEFFAL
jgi:hypothetical protein